MTPLSCAHCGHVGIRQVPGAEIEGLPRGVAIMCEGCSLVTPVCETYAEALEIWNRRAVDPRAAADAFVVIQMADFLLSDQSRRTPDGDLNTSPTNKALDTHARLCQWIREHAKSEEPRAAAGDLSAASQILDKRTRERSLAEEERDHWKQRCEQGEARAQELNRVTAQPATASKGGAGWLAGWKAAMAAALAHCRAVTVYAGRFAGDAGDEFHEFGTGATECRKRIEEMTPPPPSERNTHSNARE